MQSYNDWVKQAERGTSGDMVWDMLADWKTDIDQARAEERAKTLREVLSESYWYRILNDYAVLRIPKSKYEKWLIESGTMPTGEVRE